MENKKADVFISYHMDSSEIQLEYDILHPQLGDDHIDIGINYLMRANIHRYFGQEDAAKEYYGKALVIVDKLGLAQKKVLIEEIINSGKIGYLP